MGAPPKKQRSLNALVCCLAVLAVFLIVIAGWKQYSRRRRPGERSLEPGDAIERRIEALPNVGIAEGWIKAGGPSTAPMCRFICPQCQSHCWMRPGRGCPACPFCGRLMVPQGPGFSPVGGTGTGAGAGAAASPIKIRADVARPHGDRGVCNICHTMLRSDSLPSTLHPAGGAQSMPKALPPSRGLPGRLGGGAWRGTASPPTAPDLLRPTLIREFGTEVCPAPGAGAKVTGVMGNSYAWNAGLRAGDIIIGFNASKVRSVEQFRGLVSRAAPGTDASIKVLRNGRTRDLLIMVGEGEMEGFTPIQRR